MGHVRLRPRAVEDIDGIFDYVAERGGEARADAVIARIAKTMQSHADYPETGRRREDLRPGLRSIPSGRYVVYFFPEPDGIRVSRVLHGARDVQVADFEGDEE